MYLPDSSILTNIHVYGHKKPDEALFEKKYIFTRGLEGRLYTDEELARLPDIAERHIHYREWQMRQASAGRLVRYLSAEKKSLEILEVGCGNGWLSHQLAEIRGAEVTGLDINFTELQQAARVFNDDPNLTFVHGDLGSGIMEGRQFDCIIFAAAIEYFPSLKKILHLSLAYLKPAGEIHLLDSQLCKPDEVERERRRTLAIYASLGYPEMADYYYHHSLHELRSFHYDILYNPFSVVNRYFGAKNPCHWVRVKNN